MDTAFNSPLSNGEMLKSQLKQNIPEQKNGIDCGVFLCEYAENLAPKSKFQFTQQDTEFIRECIKTEISLMALIQDPLNM